MRGVIAFFALLPAIAGAQMYKCADAQGGVNFTDQPCNGAASSPEAEITVDLPVLPETGLQRLQREQAEALAAAQEKHKTLINDLGEAAAVLKAESERQKALYLRRIAHEGLSIGMEVQAVIDHPVWGMPARLNKTETAAGVRSQWVYPVSVNNQFETVTLYFTGSKLVVIQG